MRRLCRAETEFRNPGLKVKLIHETLRKDKRHGWLIAGIGLDSGKATAYLIK